MGGGVGTGGLEDYPEHIRDVREGYGEPKDDILLFDVTNQEVVIVPGSVISVEYVDESESI